MNPRCLLWIFVAGLGSSALLTQSLGSHLLAQSTSPVALRGHVSSAAERSMEGVVVTAKKNGSTIATSVVTDASGEFQFPAARLEPGSYTVRVRAVGYDLASGASAAIEPGHTTVADLRLDKAKNLTTQLTNAEWLASFPGTEA